MQETLKQAICDLPCISFEEYYQYYVMDIQDMNIYSEVASMTRNNIVDSSVINKLINKEIGVFGL